MTLPNCQTMVFQKGTAELLVPLKRGGSSVSRRNGSPAQKWPRPPSNVTLTTLVSRLNKRVALDHLKLTCALESQVRCRLGSWDRSAIPWVENLVRFHGLYQPIVLISTGGYSYCRANKNIQKFRKLSPASKNIQKFKSFHPRVSKNVEFQVDLVSKLLRSGHVLHNLRKVENNFTNG